ncbi:S1 RNA-binding domain-containing protein [Celerinatantimonas sp. MCCC 1A17872]|uniref:CvfB family protein n=1 Tax=Celerinatantimonas sp. MCCC 1A17872 TaxID=3177514 RepID=UPI0038C12599
MLQIGRIQPLKLVRIDTNHGVFTADYGRELLVPRKELPADAQVADEIEVFVYSDGNQQLVSTTKKPYAQVGEIGYLQVIAVHSQGAFMDLGIDKDIFVPSKAQFTPMQVGQSYAVYLYLDNQNRLSATPRLEEHLTQGGNYKRGDKVQALVSKRSELGYQVVIDHQYIGMIYHNEIFKRISVGQTIEAYVYKSREDGKLDLRLQPIGDVKLEPLQEQILEKLRADGGYLALSDKSDPKLIAAVFGVSKGQYKKAIGHLYREHLIKLSAHGIMLISDD